MGKGVPALATYAGFTVYKVKHRKSERSYACLRTKDTRTTIAWAKYVYETETGMRVPAGMTVDHIDEDRTNDSFPNLQLLSIAENIRKNARLTRAAKMVEKQCPCCGKAFNVNARYVRFFGERRKFHCSRSCSVKMQHQLAAA